VCCGRRASAPNTCANYLSPTHSRQRTGSLSVKNTYYDGITFTGTYDHDIGEYWKTENYKYEEIQWSGELKYEWSDKAYSTGKLYKKRKNYFPDFTNRGKDEDRFERKIEFTTAYSPSEATDLSFAFERKVQHDEPATTSDYYQNTYTFKWDRDW